MTDTSSQARLKIIGQIKDLTSGLNPINDPFLFHLVSLLNQHQFRYIDAALALKFVQFVSRKESQPIVYDALKILNRLVNKDGTLRPGASDIFYDNRHFIWKELGTRIAPEEIMLHVFNKTLFTVSLQK